MDQKVPVSTIVFSTIMLWYSGFLPYHNELVKANDDTIFLDVCTIKYIIFFKLINFFCFEFLGFI
jgi:hypothetical protein